MAFCGFLLDILPWAAGVMQLAFAERSLSRSMSHAIKMGHPCNVIYDIGARQGYWSKYLSRYIKAKYILFEANDAHSPELKKRGFEYFTCVLSDRVRSIEWFSDLGTGDSYYKDNTSRYENVKSKTKTATTLDNIISENSLPLPDLIKLDTQGSELDILLGGGVALKNAKFIYMETPLVVYNTGAPSFTGYIDFMSDAGFLPYDLCEIHKIGGLLVQVDILFIRRELFFELHGKESIVLGL